MLLLWAVHSQDNASQVNDKIPAWLCTIAYHSPQAILGAANSSIEDTFSRHSVRKTKWRLKFYNPNLYIVK